MHKEIFAIYRNKILTTGEKNNEEKQCIDVGQQSSYEDDA